MVKDHVTAPVACDQKASQSYDWFQEMVRGSPSRIPKGDHLRLYQIHSATLESGVLEHLGWERASDASAWPASIHPLDGEIEPTWE